MYSREFEYVFIFCLKVKNSSEKLTVLLKLKENNETKLKTLKESFNYDSVKLEIDEKKEEKNELI